MKSRFAVRQGRRVVALRDANSAEEAAIEHVRSLGSTREEITRLGGAAVSWRGAVFRAAPARETDAPPKRGGLRAP
ncbi:MAG TPA: hypothetical protein VNJ53_02510 [Gaiellaceae bacterium]|nr:hypothetical protein [Gaiellaceae bacterium]